MMSDISTIREYLKKIHDVVANAPGINPDSILSVLSDTNFEECNDTTIISAIATMLPALSSSRQCAAALTMAIMNDYTMSKYIIDVLDIVYYTLMGDINGK